MIILRYKEEDVVLKIIQDIGTPLIPEDSKEEAKGTRELSPRPH